MTKPTDTPASASNPPLPTCRVKRRLKDGTYSKEYERLVWFWLDWHYFPIDNIFYAPVFSSNDEAKEHIEEQKIEWPNFDYKIIDLDS